MEIKVTPFSRWFSNSYDALPAKSTNLSENWIVYQDHYNVQFKFDDDSVYALFPNEAAATMFMLKWSW